MTTPNHWKKVLVPTDFSEIALHGIRAAANWQHGIGVEVVLVHVTEPAHGGLRVQTGDLHNKIKHEAMESLQRIAADHFTECAKIKSVVVEGKPAEAICKAADEHEVDVIIIPTHGRSGLKHALLGSVAEKVVRQAPCSVLVVRES